MRSDRRSNLPVATGFAPELYWIIVGLGVWLAISIWGFCGSGYTALVMAIISLLVAIAVGVALLVVSLVRRRREPRASRPPEGAFQQWLGGEFDAHTGQLKGIAAAIQVILPLAAVAFGMTLFAVVRHLDVIGA